MTAPLDCVVIFCVRLCLTRIKVDKAASQTVAVINTDFDSLFNSVASEGHKSNGGPQMQVECLYSALGVRISAGNEAVARCEIRCACVSILSLQPKWGRRR